MSKQHLLLLHGWGFNHHIWSPFITRLPQHYQCNAIDLPGFGCTPASKDCYQPKRIGALVSEQLQPNTTLMGWSLGGLICLLVALQAPDQVQRVIVINTSPHFNNHYLRHFIFNFRRNGQKLLNTFIESIAHNSCERQFLQQMQDKPQQQNHTAWLDALLLLRDCDCRQQLFDLRVACHFIFCDEDKLISNLTDDHLIQHNPLITQQRLAKQGHATPLYQPTEITHALLQTKSTKVLQ